MAKLKKTLPKNLQGLILNEDWDTLKTELKKCEPDAYMRGDSEIPHILVARAEEIIWFKNSQNKDNYHRNYKYLPKEFFYWLVKENHCNVDFNLERHYDYSSTALKRYINWYQIDIVEVLLELGAKKDIDSLLHNAIQGAKFGTNFQTIHLLVKYGADIHYESHEGTALEHLIRKFVVSERNGNNWTVKYCTQTHFEEFFVEKGQEYLECIDFIIKQGADPTTPRLTAFMQEIFNQFHESYLNHYFSSPEVEEKMEQFELKLYGLMQFEPA